MAVVLARVNIKEELFLKRQIECHQDVATFHMFKCYNVNLLFNEVICMSRGFTTERGHVRRKGLQLLGVTDKALPRYHQQEA